MYSEQNLVDELVSIMCKVDDIQSMFPEYESDRYLDGVRDQAEFFIDEFKSTKNVLLYGYERYVHEINSKLIEECDDMVDGRLAINDLAHMVIDSNEVFDGFPCDETIADRSENLAAIDFARDIA